MPQCHLRTSLRRHMQHSGDNTTPKEGGRISLRAGRMAPRVSWVLFLHVITLQLVSSSQGAYSSSGGGLILPSVVETSSTSTAEGKDVGHESSRTPPNTLLIDANDIIDDMAQASLQQTGPDANEQVFKQTHVFRSPTDRSKRKRSKSHLEREGDNLLRSLKTVTTRTTNGLARAVNVTGTAASVVAGGAFKVAGAAVLDAVDGIEYVSSKSPWEVPGVPDTWRLVAKGLRKTAETVYEFGVAAENVTAEATEAAEETIRSLVGSVIESASGSGGPTRDYFTDEEDRIIDNMVFGMSSPDGYQTMAVNEEGTGDGGGGRNIGYSDEDLSTHFGRDTRRGHHHHHNHEWDSSSRPYNQQQQQRQGLLTAAPATTGGPYALGQHQQHHRRPRMGAVIARVRLAIRLSIMRTSKAVPTMRFPQMVACGMVFACRAVTKNPWYNAASFVAARMYLKFVESIYLECLKERMTSDIKFEAVARLHEGSPERARWFNTAVEAMWVPMLEPLLSRWASRQITRGIERSLPSNVSWVGLGKVTLGPTPPKIRYVQVQNVTSLAQRRNLGTSNGVIDSVLLEAGQPGGDIAGENIVYLELGVDWTSLGSKVSLKLGEQSRRRNWWSLSSYVPTYRVKLCDLGLKAKVVVAIALGDDRPFVKRLWVGFSEPPLTHLSLEALTGMDIANLPVLRKHLRHVVMRCLMPLTEPRYLNIEMGPPPPPPSPYRGAALAARVRPAALGVRRGILSRVPGFGVRTLLGWGRNTKAAATAAHGTVAELEEGKTLGGGGEQGRELEEATRRLLVEFGGEFRGETVMAAEVSSPNRHSGEDGIVVEDVSQPAIDAGAARAVSRKIMTAKTKVRAIEAGKGAQDEVELSAATKEFTMPGKARPEGKQEAGQVAGKGSKSKANAPPPTTKELPTGAGFDEGVDGRSGGRDTEGGEKGVRESAVTTATESAVPPKAKQANEEKPKWSTPLPKGNQPPVARLDEEDLDWRGNSRDRGGSEEGEEAASTAKTKMASSEVGRRRARGDLDHGDKIVADDGTESARDVPSPASKGPLANVPKGIAEAEAVAAATVPVRASSCSAAPRAGKADPAAMGAQGTFSEAAVVVTKGSRSKSEEVRERRAQIQRRRAALRGNKGGMLSPASTLVKSLQSFWGNMAGGLSRRRSRKYNPEREGMIKSVCALSRPPAPPDGS